MTKKPIIGITPLWDVKMDSIWMLPGYMEQIEHAGGIPAILPLTGDREIIRRIAVEYDGFLFTGGHDVSPAVYGEEKLGLCGEPCPARDTMEELLFRHTLLIPGKPVFGICRGLQLFNALMGGSLYQDLSVQFDAAKKVAHYSPPSQGMASHTVEICKNTILHGIFGRNEIRVNSYHHQGIKTLAQSLRPMAYSKDRLIEAVCMPGYKFAVAVQWHPEMMPDDAYAKILFKAFVDSTVT